MKTFKSWWAVALPFVLFACQTNLKPVTPVEKPPVVEATPTPVPITIDQPDHPELPEKPTYMSLSWENTTAPHPERAPWSKFLSQLIDQQLPIYEMATDLKEFCPKYYSLDRQHKIKAIGELWVAVAYRESSYNPKSTSVDVGTKNNRDTWSIGLMQMSVVDQKAYGLPMGYDYEDLLQAEPNLDLAQAVMMNRIKKYKKIQLPIGAGAYWSTLAPGKSTVADIKTRTMTKAPGCQ